MPTLDTFDAREPIKMLYVGDSTAGKTGSIASLVAAGYKVRLWDYENQKGVLHQYVKKTCPDKMGNVSVAVLQDVAGIMQDGRPFIKEANAFTRGIKLIDNWSVDGEELGKPAEWGVETVCIFDTLTAASESALRFSKLITPAGKSGDAHGLAIYGTAQELIKLMLATLKAPTFNCNVIVIAHLDYEKDHLGITKGFPKCVGNKMAPIIGAYFNSILMAEHAGSGKRQIRTVTSGIVGLKNPAAWKLPDVLPLETGLADFFKAVRS